MFVKRIQEDHINGKVGDKTFTSQELVHTTYIEDKSRFLEGMAKVGCETILGVPVS